MIDNLIAQKKIPVMIAIFISPGDITDSPNTPTFNFVKAYSEKWERTLKDSMRSTLYDTVSDRYPRFLRDEVLAEVAAKYNLRKDAYSHAITGLSSGGICSFNAAWQFPDQFSRVISWIGSFSSIQWKEDPANPDGGQDYPDKILREPKRNIRVWLQDGSEDLDPALRQLAASQSPHGQCPQGQGVRLPLQLRQRHPQLRPWRRRIPRRNDLAMARLRPRQNRTNLQSRIQPRNPSLRSESPSPTAPPNRPSDVVGGLKTGHRPFLPQSRATICPDIQGPPRPVFE